MTEFYMKEIFQCFMPISLNKFGDYKIKKLLIFHNNFFINYNL